MPMNGATSRRPYAILAPERATVLAAALAVLSIAAGVTSWMENAWRMEGLGLSQHFGMLALYTTAPILVVTLSALARHFANLLEHPLEFRTEDEAVASLIVGAWRAFGSRRDRYIAGLLSFVGVLAIVSNMMNAQAVMTVYGIDTFDSALHFGSYYIARVYLAFI
jgi:hypothetical protein